jgi:hypothetical protein
MEMILLKEGSPEWEYAWNWLSSHPINNGLENPDVALHNNEAWQYIGSYRHDMQVVHSYRHRNHPVTGDVQFLSLHASPNMNGEDIGKVIQIT